MCVVKNREQYRNKWKTRHSVTNHTAKVSIFLHSIMSAVGIALKSGVHFGLAVLIFVSLRSLCSRAELTAAC